MKIVFFESAAEFRSRLGKNHDKAEELWVGFYNQKSARGGITYREALDEALCYGWIDGVRRKIDADSYTIRFTPRRPHSKWSAINIKRANELLQAKRMRPPGIKAFEGRESVKAGYSYEERPTELGAAQKNLFSRNLKAWKFFQAQAPWYRRTSSYWVMSARKEETRLKRLRTLIGDSARGRRLDMLTPGNKRA
jgi:uncharacterized protein YdeI (YjbR/CyaY-like superfamily)